ncbi:MAG TPA: STN and carboxypeptidase regulatory-like domain-containing protein, partial [Xylanibacter oryzae]|nr:STN and carboxypeptidase regulatory-like domain-containing protein [Xylanibacter oryzae]
MKNVREKLEQLNCNVVRFSIIVLLFMFQMSAIFAQEAVDKNINVNMNAATIKEFFDEMNRQTGLNFIYNADQIKALPKINVCEHNAKARDVLNTVMKSLNCRYSIKGSIVTVSREQIDNMTRMIYGNVRDENGESLTGVPVRVKGTDFQTITDGNGYYQLKA